LNETVETALHLLEKNGCLVPFCKARSKRDEPLVFMWNVGEGEGPILSDEIDKGVASIWAELRRQIESGNIREFAFCSDAEVKFQNEPEPRRRLKVEFQDGTPETGVYYFPLKVETGRAEVGRYVVADVVEKLL